ncbi:Fis family transcriptional regulator [Myxococcus sp. CA051A]|uniref:Fis family transcriptional regulator n=1 Tax=Myxococcus llanfairpwllgwyngyllgogerychwyrndrobwllllantysiliogogogochensis TaxID=2590453 RepID=A0A540WRG7_9BACT|nr:Fis family transcriptional regulator [Myxococcus llanfairpwllgwyngyllgogerychwyrndrobwllllantysiliogogogochensis]NTX08843.1 Fis family transcriptional regulator [Myxococcus sp. CA040A]NTX40763.1 Fis family transcriptional regulator [Myxococcus sp. CA033]NTX54860.1 Fis family transcriptional regulator [Myxococcus sp. CA039A]NTX63459.1 Fis family transcriptional regulator [Myxococcus sp. CA051A]TQF11598.1 Fis family transcriptional regulator [Myxococcus llanfairpwllgwyngyllgogerychwyrndrobwll
MTLSGYREEELVCNRASLIIHGGTEEERRSWAQEAARNFDVELVEVRQATDLAAALRQRNGVLFIPDAAKLGRDAQGLILRCLQMQEERPKVVVGVSGAADAALSRGTLREDLHYRLHQAQVDLQKDGMRELLRRRWALQSEQLALKAAAAKAVAESEREAAEARRPGSVTRTLPKARKPVSSSRKPASRNLSPR